MSEILWSLSFSDWLISLSVMFSRSMHAVAKDKIFFFLWPSRIPLCKCPVIVFIHSSIDGHLGCFHILVIVNNTAVNIEVLTFFQISVLSSFGYISRSGIAGSKSRSIFNFWDTTYCFPQWLHQPAFPATVQKGSPFCMSSPAVVCWWIDVSHSDRRKMIS